MELQNIASQKPIDRWLSLAGVAISIVFYLLPKTPAVIIISLLLIFGCVFHPIWNFWWIENSKSRRWLAMGVLVICLIGLGYFVWPAIYELKINTGMPVLAHYKISDANNYQLGILISNLTITNSSEKNITIKQVAIRYTLNDKNNFMDSTVISTTPVYSQAQKKKVEAVVMRTRFGTITLMNWINLRIELSEHRVLPPSGVMSGGAFFFLNVTDLEQLVKLKKIDLVVIDSLDNETIYEIMARKEWIDDAQSSFIDNYNLKFGKL